MRTILPRTRSVIMAVTVGALAILPSRQAMAQQTFWFSFTSGVVSATGHVVANPNGNGTFTAVSGNGSVTGAVETGMFNLVSNPNGTACASTSPSSAGNYYTFDNQLLVNQSAVLSNCGLLFQFTNNTDLVNIFTDSNLGGYVLSEDPNGAGFTNYGDGAFALTTTPEPSSMALLGTGIIGLVPMVRRRRR